MPIEHQLQALGLTLPPPPTPVATYVPAVQVGELLFLSGMLPFQDGILSVRGKLGSAVNVEQGYAVSRLAVLNALAVVQAQIGSLDRIARIVRMVGYVASAPGFVQQPAVINGASDLLVSLFGEAGRHARVAIGCAELPLDAPVEIEMILHIT